MARRRYSVGDKVLVSRDESGENHEPAVVVDSYELIIGEDRRPIVVVELEDGERKYLTAATPNVLPVEPEEEEAAEGEAGEGAEDAAAGAGPDEAADVLEETVEPSSNGPVELVDDDLGSP